MSRRIDPVTGEQKVSALSVLSLTFASWTAVGAAVGVAAYFAGKLLRAVLT